MPLNSFLATMTSFGPLAAITFQFPTWAQVIYNLLYRTWAHVDEMTQIMRERRDICLYYYKVGYNISRFNSLTWAQVVYNNMVGEVKRDILYPTMSYYKANITCLSLIIYVILSELGFDMIECCDWRSVSFCFSQVLDGALCRVL